MTPKRIDWDDPAARADLICRVGVSAYNRLLAEHKRDSVVAVVNGFAIRRTRTQRFGDVFFIDDLGTGSPTLAGAKAMAAAAPRGRRR
jgi:hypothetical protein